MSILLETPYKLDGRRLANWTQNQEKAISTEYPFSTQNEPIDQYVARTYLQFLWLPESIMPLPLIVPSLRRVNAPSTSSEASVHPLHALLEPLLLDTRLVSNKYHVELPQILAEGGGVGEMEETMMWYSLTHEKGDENHKDSPWSDDHWREKYMERMERREVQIQILLLLFKISLPGPPPPIKKKRKRQKKNVEPVLTPEEHLEAFMDKLSVWQLTETINRANDKNEERDWVQKFTETVVEPLFKTQLPELCSLLRSKVFPNSPFSDTEKNTTSTSPEATKRSLSRVPSTSCVVSPTQFARGSNLQRARSRSLSVSLAQEMKEKERIINAPSKKPIFNREISMSRVFKPKPKPPQADTQPKPTLKSDPLPPPPTKPSLELGVTLVEETPVKVKARPRVVSSANASTTFKRPSLFSTSSAQARLPHVPESPSGDTQDDDDGEEEEEWMMESSPPDVVFLNPKRDVDSDADNDNDEDEDGQGQGHDPITPSRPPRKRR